MAEISAKAVKELREQTGAGMMDCKRALSDAEGDAKKAVELLRERGLAKAAKKATRATSEGLIAISLEGPVGGIVEVACETDFVARNAEFVGLCDSLAAAGAADAGIGDAEALLDAEVGGVKVRDRITDGISKLGENIVARRVARIDVGTGLVGGYVHAGGKLGVLVGLASASQGSALEVLAKDLAMHVAAADPTPVAVDRDGVSAEFLDAERALYRRQAEQEGKPEKVIDRIVEGRVNKLVSEVALLEQPFVKDPDRAVSELLAEVGKELGGEVRVEAFQRFRLGESGEA